MAEILVLAEHDGEAVKKVTLELVTLARRFGAPAVVWTGPGAESAQARLAEHGAAKVYVAAGPEYDEYVVAPKAELLAELAKQSSPAAVLLANTAEGREVGGRLAVKTGWGILTDVVGLDDDMNAEQVIFGGAINVTSRVRSGTPIIAVRPNTISPEAAPGEAAIEPVSITVSDAAKQARITERVVQQRDARPELTEASIVVSGGRGVAQRSGRRARARTQAGTRTSSRSASLARRCRRSSTSPSASRGRSSTGPGCRPRRRSWW